MLLGLLLFCAVAWVDCKAGHKPSSDGTTCVPSTDQCEGPLTTAGCATCTGTGSAQTCLTCSSSKKVRPDKKGCIASCPPSVTTENGEFCECKNGYKPSSDGTTCVPSTDQCEGPLTTAGCATCTGTGSAQTCLTCSSSKKVRPDKKGCIASCPPSVTTENSGVCECTPGNKPSSDGTTCVSETACNTPNCKACDNPKTDNEVCTECNDNNYLTPTNQCIPDCTAISGYYGDTDKKCKACSPECAECVGPASNQCSACPAGKALTYGGSDPAQGGTCGDACTADKNGCKVCGARIGGTDYCSQCSVGAQAPLNGVCTANARVQFCTQIADGSCTVCRDGYFLKDGGCYKPDQQPGKQVCTQANGGKCQTCTNGLAADNGDCSKSVCHSTCATCSAPSIASSCKTCATGYYKENGSDTTAGLCKKCSEKISGCKQCVSSSGSSVICLESEAGTGGSVNKSGLSTGAIAGISVAVIVIVGGLVGFLCWWFLCRGKA
ncbi:Variant-specific surface protein [Giardia duodenalis]|uniref:Variant-specific surface protein n=1 Tax=Giardia intestinalis TaxID=5741 RepID=V6TDI7_GIAIN|nr:Variant-specific surface protein [Giardia intestinalis]